MPLIYKWQLRFSGLLSNHSIYKELCGTTYKTKNNDIGLDIKIM